MASTTCVERRYLFLTVFIGGVTSLGIELAAARLLEPYFGTSNIVWASIIGLILVYLTLGYWLGGRLADRAPRPDVLYRLVAWAAFTTGLVPFAARPVLRFAAQGFATFHLGVLGASLLGVLLLFAVPVTLLGCLSPFAIRLLMGDTASAGRVAGGVYALSTLGSIIGVFLPVLVLIPAIGTRNTFLTFAGLLLLISLGGLALARYRRTAWYALMAVILVALAVLLPRGAVKAAEGLIYERESAYNYIQVIERDGVRYLLLNEGQGVHSVYDPANLSTFGAWDYFLLAPFFNPPPHPPEQARSLCLIGLAAGTVARQYTAVFGPIPIDGVEIDPAIVEVGRRYFAMNEPNLHVVVADGRAFLERTDRRYDVIAVDAYRLPYIPFHLCTREFFSLVWEHLTERGVVAVNVGRTESDQRLIAAIGATLQQVFPSVYVVDVPETFNSVVFATVQPGQAENLVANGLLMQHPLLQDVAQRAWPRLRPVPPGGMVFTDDRAPVEQMTNLLVLRYLLEGE